MKRIMLAPRGKRIMASLIDALILLASTLILYLTAVMPFTFDDNKIQANNAELIQLYTDCELFVMDENGNTKAKNDFKELKQYDDLYNIDIKFGEKTYEDVNIVKSLYVYYSSQHANYAGEVNYEIESFKTQILKVGSKESNIADFNPTTYRLSLLDDTKKDVTFNFINKQYQLITSAVSSSGRIDEINMENQMIVINSFALILPVFFGFSLIFNLIIPLCSPFGQTIGKHIFHLILLDKDGYHLKKWWLIPRWLVYSVFEYLGAILTFGATFLISYTMFMFNKKRRCLHDYAGNSVVVDRRDSIFFKDKQEERYFEERLSAQKAIEKDAEQVG